MIDYDASLHGNLGPKTIPSENFHMIFHVASEDLSALDESLAQLFPMRYACLCEKVFGDQTVWDLPVMVLNNETVLPFRHEALTKELNESLVDALLAGWENKTFGNGFYLFGGKYTFSYDQCTKKPIRVFRDLSFEASLEETIPYIGDCFSFGLNIVIVGSYQYRQEQWNRYTSFIFSLLRLFPFSGGSLSISIEEVKGSGGLMSEFDLDGVKATARKYYDEICG